MIDRGLDGERVRRVAPRPWPEARYRRCGGTSRLIVDDGPALCRICLMAWVWLAKAVTSGETIAEPDLVALRRLGRRRYLDRLDERPRPG